MSEFHHIPVHPLSELEMKKMIVELQRENAALREELAEVKKAFSPTFVRELHAECLNLKRENDTLKAWKESALSLNAEMDEQSLAKMLGGELGKSCRKIIAEKVPMLVEENAALRAEIKSVLDALNTAANEGGFDGYDEDTPLLVNLTSHWDRLYTIADKEIKKLQKENTDLKELEKTEQERIIGNDEIMKKHLEEGGTPT